MTGPDLAVLVPSRGRPGNIRDLIAAFDATCTARTALWVLVDDDDPVLAEYQTVMADTGVGIISTGVRQKIGPLLNSVAPEVADGYRAVGFMGDDHRPRSTGWDTTMLHALDAMGGGIVYGDDLIHGQALPTAMVMSPSIVRALGWICPPGIEHMYLDNAWLELGRALGRIRYLPGLVIEHMHPLAGKAADDDTYRATNVGAQYARDRAAFETWRDQRLTADVDTVRRALDG